MKRGSSAPQELSKFCVDAKIIDNKENSFVYKSSIIPTIIDVGSDGILDTTVFFDRFGNASAYITGSKGVRIEQIRLDDVRTRWWAHSPAVPKDVAASHVVHWPLAPHRDDDAVAPIICASERAIEAIGTETKCLLDQFRRDDTPFYLWAILGPAGSRVAVHQDMFGTASWNILLSGRKTWMFWDSHQSPAMDAPTAVFEQEPGQIVWIPENWWHSVIYETSSLCISKNLVLERSLLETLRQLGDAEPKLARHLTALAALFLSQGDPHAA